MLSTPSFHARGNEPTFERAELIEYIIWMAQIGAIIDGDTVVHPFIENACIYDEFRLHLETVMPYDPSMALLAAVALVAQIQKNWRTP